MSVHRNRADLDFTELETASEVVYTKTLSHLLVTLAATDFLTVAAATYVTALIYFRVALSSWPPTESYIASAFCIAGLVLFVSIGFRHYARLQTQPRHKFLWNGVGAVALAFSFFLSALFLFKITEDYSRATFFFQLFAVVAAVSGMRAVGHSLIQAAIADGRVKARRAILIGDPAHYAEVTEVLADAGVDTLRVLPFPVRSGASDAVSCADLDQTEMRRMISLCRRIAADDIIILSTTGNLRASARLADFFSELPVSLHMIPVEARDLFSTHRRGELGALSTVQLLRPPLSAFDRMLKRAFDIAAASSGLLTLSPLLLGVAIAIKLDSPGPSWFWQTRHGYNNRAIRVLKFRTMTLTEDGHAFTQATNGDPRVTRIGRFLRRTNVDELPQLFNVLMGDMSIVGPRPHPIALNKMFEERILPFSRRHNVKPGITGWAQVHGHRGQTDTLEKMQHRFEHDLYYIDNWSFMLDIKIILMTMFSKSAYRNAV
jgi:Undecaprenyl-phosphate glucose phosphotransferase